MATWQDLSWDLQSKILALVPTSVQKLLLRGVSKAWRALLSDPAAHNCIGYGDVLNTEHMPACVLQPMKALRIAASDLSNLPSGLQTLVVWVDPAALCTIPVLPCLTDLRITLTDSVHGETRIDPLQSSKLPALQRLTVECSIRRHQPHALLASLEDFASLKQLTFKGRNLPEVVLPDGCIMHAIVRTSATGGRLLAQYPSVAAALTRIEVVAEAGTADFSTFGQLLRLQEVAARSLHGDHWSLRNLTSLPPGVRAVEVHSVPGLRGMLIEPEFVASEVSHISYDNLRRCQVYHIAGRS